MNDPLHKKILQEIRKTSLENLEEEICGLIIDCFDGFKFLPCENLSKNKKNTFLIDSREIIKHNIKYIVHSHTIGSSLPSKADQLYCDEILIPFLIYSNRHNTFHVYYNNKVKEYKV